MLLSMTGRRWDGDERGEGVADASPFVDGADQLIAAMRHPTWVAEQPEAHLLPHLEMACESLPLQIIDAGTADDGSYDVQLRWTGDERSVGVVRAAVFNLVAGIAETSSYVRQRRTARTDCAAEMLMFEVVTGIVDETPFKPHGHTLRLTVAADS
jgi:hypothetical protein